MVSLLRTVQAQLSRQFISISRTKQACQRCLSTSGTGAGLDLQFDDDIAVITMKNNDNRINALFLREFNGLLDCVQENKACKGLITRGEGKFYGNGVDQAWATTVSAEEVILFSNDLNAFFRRFLMFPVPTLAQINGHCFAGAAVLALAHDLRTMNSDKGWLCLNEVLLSVRFSELMMALVRAKLGTNLSDAVLLARRYTAAEALHCQLVHAASPMVSLEADSRQLLKTFLGKHGIPRAGVTIMKEHIYEAVDRAVTVDSADNMVQFSTQFMNEGERVKFRK